MRALLAREPGVLHLTCREELEGYYRRFGFRRLERAEMPPYFRRLTRLINLIAPLTTGTHIIVRRHDPP